MSRRPTVPTDCDIAFAGGGFRTTTFLASAPQLLRRRIRVYERGTALGPGGFALYGIITSSIGSRFFQHLDRAGPFAPVVRSPQVAEVAEAQQPVAMPRLAAALSELGAALQDTLGAAGLRRCSTVVAVHANTDDGRVLVQLSDGSAEYSRHVVLATGRVERPHPELARWRSKVWLSGAVLATGQRHWLKARMAEAGHRPVVVAGCSHSAMSALQVLLDLRARLRDQQPGRPLPPIRVIRRSPARLMYDSAEDARRGQRHGRERVFDPDADVCPVTGIVYRDSGLRHQSRALYCALWAGKLAGATLVEARVLADAADHLDEAELIVQALGYHGHAPDIHINGVLVRPGDSSDRLLADDDGALLVNGVPHPLLSVLRVEPTPPDRRDNTAYASDLYPRLASRLALVPSSWAKAAA